MKFQTLAVAVNQTNHVLAEQLNIQTEALIGNQCDHGGTETVCINGHKVVYLNAEDRGVGKNRNRLLENADGDFLILADDDMRFIDGYPEIAKRAVAECKDADIYIFNLIEKESRRYINKKITRVGYRQYARYGAARLMLRREAIEQAGIRFNTEFGGGAIYGSGEDTIFLKDCLDRKLKLYAVPYALAEIDQEAASSWFHGYDYKFFFDKGVLYCVLHPRLKWLYSCRFVLYYHRKFSDHYSMLDAMRAMCDGIKSYR